MYEDLLPDHSVYSSPTSTHVESLYESKNSFLYCRPQQFISRLIKTTFFQEDIFEKDDEINRVIVFA